MDPKQLKALGIQPAEFDVLWEQFRGDPAGFAMAIMERARPVLEEHAKAIKSKYEAEAHLLDQPIPGPIPVEVATDLEADPLVFTLELTREAEPTEIEALTAWIAKVCGAEPVDDEDDHVSFWSDASAGSLPGPRHRR